MLLSRLDKVRRMGAGRWIARCPAHDDHGPSLAVRELDDGRVLLHCFSGCAPGTVLDTVGLTFADLFPERLGGLTGLRRERRPFPASDVLVAVSFEVLIVWSAGRAALDGCPWQGAAHDRLLLAVARIGAALDYVGVRHG